MDNHSGEQSDAEKRPEYEQTIPRPTLKEDSEWLLGRYFESDDNTEMLSHIEYL